jgi:hypothetical protein
MPTKELNAIEAAALNSIPFDRKAVPNDLLPGEQRQYRVDFTVRVQGIVKVFADEMSEVDAKQVKVDGPIKVILSEAVILDASASHMRNIKLVPVLR